MYYLKHDNNSDILILNQFDGLNHQISNNGTKYEDTYHFMQEYPLNIVLDKQPNDMYYVETCIKIINSIIIDNIYDIDKFVYCEIDRHLSYVKVWFTYYKN